MTGAAHGALIAVAAIVGGTILAAGEMAVWGAGRWADNHRTGPTDLYELHARIDRTNRARGHPIR